MPAKQISPNGVIQFVAVPELDSAEEAFMIVNRADREYRKYLASERREDERRPIGFRPYHAGTKR